MNGNQVHDVTWAFGYSGKYIAQRLLEAGREVRTLTNSPGKPNPFGGQVRALPFNFDRPEALSEWARANAATLGGRYASELARRK